MSKRVKVNVGTLNEMGQPFVNAWHRLKRGQKVRERHLTFPDLPAMLNALSPRHLKLPHVVHENPAPSVKTLAERLARDHKRVHEDLEMLTASGLLRREDGSISAPYDAVTAEVRL